MSEETGSMFGNGFADLVGKLAEEIKEDPIKMEDEFEYPMEISGIQKKSLPMVHHKEIGTLVQIRPCAKEYENKTYLGIYMGEFPIDTYIGLHEKTNILDFAHVTNPAIFVPELKKIIFGCESWWGDIKSEEELNDITDNDIDNVWYMRLLKQMDKKTDGEKEII